jgi:acyl dehydratase
MLKPGFYSFDQVQLGDELWTDWAAVTPHSIDAFAALTGDRFAIHLSDEGARAHGFDRRVAHGLLVLSLVEGLKSTALAQLDTFASLGWEWSFRAPVFAGDSIRAVVTVIAKRAAGAGKGMLTLAVKVQNQEGQIVQQGQTRLMAKRATNP